MPRCTFVDYSTTSRNSNGDDVRESTEPSAEEVDIPPYIVGLTLSREDTAPYLLYTQLGVIYALGWAHEMDRVNVRPGVEDDPWDWHHEYGLTPEDQIEWRENNKHWTMPNFFEMHKENCRVLNYVPVGRGRVHSFLCMESCKRWGL